MKSTRLHQLAAMALAFGTTLIPVTYAASSGKTYFSYAYSVPGQSLLYRTQAYRNPQKAYQNALKAVQYTHSPLSTLAPVGGSRTTYAVEYLGIDDILSFQTAPATRPGFDCACHGVGATPQEAYQAAREYAEYLGHDVSGLPLQLASLEGKLSVAEYDAEHGYIPDEGDEEYVCAVCIHLKRAAAPALPVYVLGLPLASN